MTPAARDSTRSLSGSGYTRHHPRWYRPPVPILWWLRKPAYVKFILRELTSPFVAYGALLLVAKGWFLGQGAESYAGFESWLRHPLVLAFHLVVLAGVLFHSITWLNLTPKVIVLRPKGRKVPDWVVASAHYLGWVVVSAVIFWLLLEV